jgi:hypothetical protein
MPMVYVTPRVTKSCTQGLLIDRGSSEDRESGEGSEGSDSKNETKCLKPHNLSYGLRFLPV